MLHLQPTLLFVAAAAGLLGSPGPGIAALIAVGRSHGPAKALPFFASMQAGLLVAMTVCALGLWGVVQSIPHAAFVLSLLAALYLVYLGWKIATAPVGGTAAPASASPRLLGGFLLGSANPKAYVAFIALLGFPPVAATLGSRPDLLFKVVLTMIVTTLVDAAWLLAGALLGAVGLSSRRERWLNRGFGLVLILSAGLEML